MQQVIADSLTLSVPEKYQTFLSRPTWNIIKSGKEAIDNYVKSSEFSVSHLAENEKKRELFDLACEEQRAVITLNLSGERDFCHYLNSHRETSLSSYFQQPSLKLLSELYLSDCGLKTVPDWGHMKYLSYVDVSGNDLTEIPPSTTIKHLNILSTNIRYVIINTSAQRKNDCSGLG